MVLSKSMKVVAAFDTGTSSLDPSPSPVSPRSRSGPGCSIYPGVWELKSVVISAGRGVVSVR